MAWLSRIALWGGLGAAGCSPSAVRLISACLASEEREKEAFAIQEVAAKRLLAGRVRENWTKDQKAQALHCPSGVPIPVFVTWVHSSGYHQSNRQGAEEAAIESSQKNLPVVPQDLKAGLRFCPGAVGHHTFKSSLGKETKREAKGNSLGSCWTADGPSRGKVVFRRLCLQGCLLSWPLQTSLSPQLGIFSCPSWLAELHAHHLSGFLFQALMARQDCIPDNISGHMPSL